MFKKQKLDNNNFEAHWKLRFRQFAGASDDDAGIAGWSQTGLQARVRNFAALWKENAEAGMWLDAGCGAGTYSRFLESKGMRVVGLDYCYQAVHKAKHRSSGSISWGVADVKKLPVKAGAFDSAMCFGVTQALPDSDGLSRELVAAIKPGGEVWIDALNSWCLPHLVGRYQRILTGRVMHLRYETPRQLSRSMAAAGFAELKRFWIPILPHRLQRFQWLFETKVVSWIFHAIPPVGALLSHAFVIKATRER